MARLQSHRGERVCILPTVPGCPMSAFRNFAFGRVPSLAYLESKPELLSSSDTSLRVVSGGNDAR